jgi:hypothetical protein
MDTEWDSIVPFTPLVSKSQQFPVAFLLMAIGENSAVTNLIGTAVANFIAQGFF